MRAVKKKRVWNEYDAHMFVHLLFAGAGIIASPRVVDAMMNVDRKFYCPPGAKPYEDAPQMIGHNVTISAPHMHAMCLGVCVCASLSACDVSQCVRLSASLSTPPNPTPTFSLTLSRCLSRCLSLSCFLSAL